MQWIRPKKYLILICYSFTFVFKWFVRNRRNEHKWKYKYSPRIRARLEGATTAFRRNNIVRTKWCAGKRRSLIIIIRITIETSLEVKCCRVLNRVYLNGACFQFDVVFRVVVHYMNMYAWTLCKQHCETHNNSIQYTRCCRARRYNLSRRNAHTHTHTQPHV